MLDAGSSFTVNHGLSSTPTAISIEKLWSSSSDWQRATHTITGLTATNFTIQFLAPTGSFMAGAAASFVWFAIA